MADWLTQLSHRIDDHVADAQADAQLSALVDGRGHPAQPLPARAHPGRSTFHDEVESGREVAPDGRGPSPFAPAAVRPLFGVSDDKIAAVSKAATSIQAAERGRAARARSPRTKDSLVLGETVSVASTQSLEAAEAAAKVEQEQRQEEEEQGVSASWLDQSVSASSRANGLATHAASPAYHEAEARLAHDRARLRSEWEHLTREKERLAAQRRDFEEAAAIVTTANPGAAIPRASSARGARHPSTRPGSAPAGGRSSADNRRRRGGHRAARRRAAQAAADSAYAARLQTALRTVSSTGSVSAATRPQSAPRGGRLPSPVTTKQDIGHGARYVHHLPGILVRGHRYDSLLT